MFSARQVRLVELRQNLPILHKDLLLTVNSYVQISYRYKIHFLPLQNYAQNCDAFTFHETYELLLCSVRTDFTEATQGRKQDNDTHSVQQQ